MNLYPICFLIVPIAVYMWRTISTALGATSRPTCFTQYFWWIASLLPVGTNVHILGIAVFCWGVWKTRNRACFEKKYISSPLELICYMCAFLRYWAALQKENMKQVVEEGARCIQDFATKMQKTRSSRLQISEEGESMEQDGEA